MCLFSVVCVIYWVLCVVVVDFVLHCDFVMVWCGVRCGVMARVLLMGMVSCCVVVWCVVVCVCACLCCSVACVFVVCVGLLWVL